MRELWSLRLHTINPIRVTAQVYDHAGRRFLEGKRGMGKEVRVFFLLLGVGLQDMRESNLQVEHHTALRIITARTPPKKCRSDFCET